MGMRLSQLGLTGPDTVEVEGLAVDNRRVRPGDLFAALPGSATHGARFAGDALDRGAVAVLTDPEGAAMLPDGATVITVEDPRAALAFAAALLAGAQPDCMVAVTGTNGKTSVAAFTRQLWEALGLSAANIGTTGVEGAFHAPSAHTTPEPITLHRLLADMAAAGVTHAAMEASSHGLDQRRLEAVRLAAAGFTNLTQDHLDYHGTMEAYFEAKAGLFYRLLPGDGVAVVNIDDAHGVALAAACEARGQEVITVGEAEAARLRLTGQRFDATGQEVLFRWQGRASSVRLDLIGGFQAANALLAAGLVIAGGEDPEATFAALPKLSGVRGRMQLAATRANGATAFVDYAHTPDAVETALRALRPHVMGRIVAIVGAGGDRDRGKRPLMGQAAQAHAEVVIVTDDNPRSEDPGVIRAAVIEGAPGATEIGDRAEAILTGADMLEPGDALLIMGKGHETGQTVGDMVLPFDDVEQASISVAALEGRA
ncbi:UDP-N-acetylmuramoyl-L-alanyl-D-glutamate--2,6-diaminopimelate ligase [Jannaschia pagri]|uniref:UDP-N-acetylmuramoyl-L-alanyl-D-glutamate--2,6-diaminopimelate ligase n=1 Tax=Jannaschia pagri TaxID=2829797 RepID=A0ABQ4NJ54_9RHOB|nr:MULTISPECIES: UDP-N-acetylmuramoyl-L-alanyl-D-glutamate--2,6-diaminopimelate ligase [unclassified Jannaschia]GIT90618.1 UDP-N-acetylmuramoyl-L-alanyl-D-glutamate--2,6-diaminopimelate ligase [Jannaschia sp. AI_61]GIT94450.1 UDP-N-acetylmuramoyl-L-alanyl-D-glutamate--2,6-diaminopimelate ligase [Jannaschia sp. AI_62]